MKLLKGLIIIFLSVGIALSSSPHDAQAKTKKPNILVI